MKPKVCYFCRNKETYKGEHGIEKRDMGIYGEVDICYDCRDKKGA